MGPRQYGALVLCVAFAAPAVASAQPVSTTTSTAPGSTTTGPTTSSTRVPRASTTTTPPMAYNEAWDAPAPHGNEEEQADLTESPPASDGPVLDVDLANATFDPRAAEVYAQWNAARADLASIRAAHQARVDEATRLVTAAADASRALGTARAEARAGSKALRQYVVSVYMNPSVEPNDESRRGLLMAQLRDVLVRTYARTRDRVGRLQDAAAAATAAATQADRFAPPAQEDHATKEAQARVDALAAALRLYAVGSTGTPPNFRFPVGGPYRFSNSWGAPRMVGTASAHSHKGTDVFAATSTPLLAVEPGTVVRRGTDRLGGLKLWLIGDSGYVYYYAHLESFVASVVDGTRVAAGQTVGFVGNSGNARGGAPHVHFEVHVRGVAVNPYPLLAVASSGDPFNRR